MDIYSIILSAVLIAFGALLGWLFPELSRSRHDKKDREELIKHVRTTIHIEINQNLDALTIYRDRLDKVEISQKYRQDEKGKELTKAEKCIDMPNPEWNFGFFHNQLNSLVLAFKKDEIIAINVFYDRLKQIHRILQRLKELGAECAEDLRYITIEERKWSDSRERNAKTRFKENALKLLSELEDIIGIQMIKRNPLE